MANTIQLRLLDNKSIVASMQGIPLANENSYRIIAGEQNATNFAIMQKPTQYAEYTYYVEMVNSQGYGISKTAITETITVNGSSYPKFNLPVGMAVAGYGYISITAETGSDESLQIIKFAPLKIKVWNTLPEWKGHVKENDSYDLLEDKPIINQDLEAGGFIPTVNTYYKHIGETSSNYTKGIIYLYTSAGYKEIDGKATIVQTTGQSTTSVMSQKAVTDELSTKVGLMRNETVGGQKTFAKNLETKDRFVVVNKGATELISGLAGTIINTGATSLLFKGQWEFANAPTNADTERFSVNFKSPSYCAVKPNKGVCLYNMSPSVDGGATSRVVSLVNNERFSNAINPNGTETAGTIYILSHTKNSSTYDFNGETLTLSQLWNKYGIQLSNNSGAYDITFIYLYGTGSFYLRNTGLSAEYNFGSGTVTVNGTEYTFSMYILNGATAFSGEWWLPNVTYNFGDDFGAVVSVSQYGTVTKEMWEQFLYVFEPHTSYQTQTTPTAYSVVYDKSTESVKIGYGYYNTAGEYVLYDELSDSIATREDSAQWTDGNLPVWDSTKNRLVDSELSVSDILKKPFKIINTDSTAVVIYSPNEPTEYHYENIEYFYGELTSLTIGQNGIPSQENAGDRFHISFKSGATPTTITIDNTYIVTPTTVGANKNVEIDGYCVYDGANWRYSLKISEV